MGYFFLSGLHVRHRENGKNQLSNIIDDNRVRPIQTEFDGQSRLSILVAGRADRANLY